MSSDQPRALLAEPLEGVVPQIGRWLWALEDTRRRTKACLEGLPLAAIDWRSPQEDNTIGTLLYHIAAIEMDWLYTDILQQDFPPQAVTLFPDPVRDEQGQLTAVTGISLSDHITRLHSSRALFLAAFREITLEEFHRVRHFPRYTVTPAWVLHHLCQHEAEHRGQMMTLRTQWKNSEG